MNPSQRYCVFLIFERVLGVFQTLPAGTSEHSITVAFSKTSGTTAHSFDCAGQLCGGLEDDGTTARPVAEKALSVKHMDLVRTMEIFDESTVPFSGRVFFPTVAAYTIDRGAAHPTVWPWSDSDESGSIYEPCYYAGAKVCLRDAASDGNIVCATTAADGTYSMGAPVGLNLIAAVSLRGGTEVFSRTDASRTRPLRRAH